MTITRINPKYAEIVSSSGGDFATPFTMYENGLMRVVPTHVDASVVPTSNQWCTYDVYDKKNVRLGYLAAGRCTDSTDRCDIGTANASGTYNTLSLRINDSGTRSVTVSDQAAWRTGIGAAAASHTHTLSQVTNALSIVKVVRKHATAVSVAANTTVNIYVNVNDQTGYKPIGVAGATTNHLDCMLVAAEIDPSNANRVYAAVRNITGSAKSCSPYFDVLYLRTS